MATLIVKSRQERGAYNRFRGNGKPIEGPNYHKMTTFGSSIASASSENTNKLIQHIYRVLREEDIRLHNEKLPLSSPTHRRAGQLTSCCSNYVNLTASENQISSK